MNIDDLLPQLQNVKKTGNGYTARCPAHDDQKNSLSVKQADEGKVLFHCFVGCTYEQISFALGISKEVNQSSKEIVAIYDYKDENGTVLYQNIRFAPKEFRQRHFDQDGKPVWGLNGVRRVPYRLPDLVSLKSLQDVIMTEGEKDADTLTELGFPATNSKNWKKEFNDVLKGKNVIIFQDHDRAGKNQTETLLNLIYEDAKAIKVVDCFADEPLPDKHGKDVSDYLENNSLEDLRALIGKTPIYSPSNESTLKDNADLAVEENIPNLFLVKSANEWLEEAKKRPIPKMLFGELWFEGEICILFSDTNLGKSILAVQIAESIAKGKQIEFFKLTAPSQKVLYFDFELSDKQFELRCSVEQGEYFGNHYEFSENFYRAEINPDGDIPERFESFEDYLIFSPQLKIAETEATIIIIDNLTYLRDETEKAKNALPLMKQLKQLKSRFGLSILVLAHTPKRDLSKRITRNDLAGSKMLINFCDSSFTIGESHLDKNIRYIKQIKVRNTDFIYDTDNVCVCQIQKAENFLEFYFLAFGHEIDHLKHLDEEYREKLITKVKELSESGKSQREIAAELQISLGAVNKYLRS